MDQFHHEVGSARVGGAAVEHLGDVRVVHQRQGLPLGLEAGDHLAGVHARLDDLQGHLAADRLLLLGHVDHAHAPFADLLQQLVAADDRAGAFGEGGMVEGGGDAERRALRESCRLRRALAAELLDSFAQVRIVAAGFVQVTLRARSATSISMRLEEDRLGFVHRRSSHGLSHANGLYKINARIRPRTCSAEIRKISRSRSALAGR